MSDSAKVYSPVQIGKLYLQKKFALTVFNSLGNSCDIQLLLGQNYTDEQMPHTEFNKKKY